ncbi:MAG TPA: hypothetical protein VNI34_02345 [Candidatus Nitrosotalea sp.]|nr:hypothetical protein [Candidatus Nitrosotalea sp.]
MSNLYQIIDELRQERAGAASAATLDLVSQELGRTQDNLGLALAHLADRALPTGGRATLEELRLRAEQAEVDDISVPIPRAEVRASIVSEDIDGSQVGIAVLLGGTALVAVVLALLVFGQGLHQILHVF